MVIGRLPVLTVATALSMVVNVRGETDARDRVEQSYLELVQAYRSEAREEAVDELGTWGPLWIEWGAKGLLSHCERIERTPLVPLWVRTAQSAFLLHIDTALTAHRGGWLSPEHERHMEAALRLLRWFRDRPQPEEAFGLKPRDFYLALAGVELRLARPQEAIRLAEESLRQNGQDAEMRLLAGCAEETAALILRQSDEDREARSALRRAAGWLQEALDENPELAEARLRLGWVLLQRGWPQRARPLLEAVTQTPGDDRRRALAWLFLGRAHEHERRLEEAITAYRRAAELAPGSQAARVALAMALERHSGDAAAREVLQQFFLREYRSRGATDLWAEYPFGPPELTLRPFDDLCERLAPR